MLKKAMIYLFFVFSFLAVTVLCAYAECQHDFTFSEDRTNVIVNEDMTHSYRCSKKCGAYGTVSDGINGRVACTLYLVSDEKPSCISEGKLIYTCSVCFRNVEEAVSIIEHSYYKVRTLPTCTRQGYDTYTCTVCGDSYCDNYNEPLKHISDGGIVEILPTYEKEGAVKVSCRVCGTLIESKKLDKLIREAEMKPSVGKVHNLKSVKNTASAVKLLWDKAVGADSYKVFVSTDKKNWKILRADKTYITVKGLKSARIYYFKITSVSNGTDGKESELISVCTKPLKAALTKVKSDEKSSVTLKWKKLTGISGYELSYTEDSFSKKKTVKKTTVKKGTSKTLRKLKSGKKYHFRVRAYKTFRSVKIYGAYSKTKSIRIR